MKREKLVFKKGPFHFTGTFRYKTTMWSHATRQDPFDNDIRHLFDGDSGAGKFVTYSSFLLLLAPE